MRGILKFIVLVIVTAISMSAQTLDVRLSSESQTIESLTANGFDFAPSDRLDKRKGDGYYQTGDVRFAVRKVGTTDWQWFSTAAKRRAVTTAPLNKNDLAAADLTATLPENCPVKVIRRWKKVDGKIVLRFEILNIGPDALELGALGFPLSFNNIISDRNLAEAHEKCSFADPYIGEDAGYVQVTRLKGNGPALVVVPEGKTPLETTPLEAWNTLTEPTRVSQTFEGTFEWLVHTRALAETNWKNATPWNSPTSATLAPNQVRTYALKFIAAPEIRKIEETLTANSRPVAVGIPGYILPAGVDGKLFVNHNSRIASVESEPRGAIEVKALPNAKNWRQFSVNAKAWGRARLTINYANGERQTIHYYLTKPAVEAVGDLGKFLFSKQWFDVQNDPFGRSPSVISYDRETNAPVAQDNRAWIAGLGDEAGSGSWLAAAMKEEIAPDAAEVAKLERFIDEVVWGRLQYSDGAEKYGVKKSLFYYAPDELKDFKYDPKFDWTTWASWKKDHAASTGRAYNYPHVVAAYLAMYRLARNHDGLVENHPWRWYLAQATETTKFVFSRKADGTRRVEYSELGLMEGTVFLELLNELKREGLTTEVADVEKIMRERADAWAKEEYPFGSEMAWDSTGQEEVYAWCKYFGFDDKALVSLNSIVGYMPTLPHWGYNGNARRYWDFLYGGKLKRIERQLHHYGSGMNAIPILSHFRAHPDDFYLLRIGYGGMMGALSNIDRDGFASAAFHSYPDTLRWDAYSGDYGPNFYGHATNSATYVVDHPEFGWQAFGGNVTSDARTVFVEPNDAVRRRVFIAPLGLWLTLDNGRFDRVLIARNLKTVSVTISGTKKALLRVEKTVAAARDFAPTARFATERGAFAIPIGVNPQVVELRLIAGR